MLAALVKENEKLHQENSVLFAAKARTPPPEVSVGASSGYMTSREHELAESLKACEAKIARYVCMYVCFFFVCVQ